MSTVLSPSDFIRNKFGGPFHGHLILWEKPTKRTFSFAADELDQLDAKVIELASSNDLYIALGTQAEMPAEGQRGGADTVVTLPGFFGDIDFASSKDSTKKYPPDEETALKVLQAFPLQPTTLVRTGNGLHAHWDLQQPVTLANEHERNDAKALWRDFQRKLQQHFTGHGFAIDSVGDLSRLYRIPGTFNHKSSPFKPVEIIERGEKVTLEAVRKLVAETAHKEAPKRDKKKKAKKQSLADHEKIKEGCAWYREKVVEGAATCPYPDWIAGASITARCGNGEEIFHEYSAKHPEYKRDEAAKLLQQVSGEDSGPRTCKSVREQLGHEAICAACPHWGKITSPIQLGNKGGLPYDPGKTGPVPLGYSDSNYFFRNQQTKQVAKKSANQLMSMAGLLDMAPAPFWLDAFTIDDKFNQVAACNSLIQACRTKGPLNASKIRGAGVWREGDRTIVNLGGEQIESDEFIYAAPQEPLTLSQDNPPTNALLDLLSVPNWQSKSAPALLFGWAVISVICGALPWRPHMAITGPAKAGKSTTWKAIAEALAPMAILLDGSSSEAGIRQHIGPSARPVLLDEFDVRTKPEMANAGRVAKLMRSASSAVASVARGTPEGKAFSFNVNVCFLVAGINIHTGTVADTSRIVRLELEKSDDPERSGAELARLQNAIKGMGPAFCNMAITHANDVLASIPILRSAMPGLDARQGDNFATLLAGFFVGINRRAITPEEARELVAEHREAIDEHVESQEEDDAQECLNVLLGYLCRLDMHVETVNRSIGQLLAELFGANDWKSRAEVLGQHGIRVEGDSFLVANSHPQLAKIFQRTPWADGLWKMALSRLPGAEKLPQRRFVGGPVSRAVKLPKALAIAPEKDDQIVTPSLVSRKF